MTYLLLIRSCHLISFHFYDAWPYSGRSAMGFQAIPNIIRKNIPHSLPPPQGKKKKKERKKKRRGRQTRKLPMHGFCTLQLSVPITNHQIHNSYSYPKFLDMKRNPQIKVAKATGARRLAGRGSYPIIPPPRTFPQVSPVSSLWFRQGMLY